MSVHVELDRDRCISAGRCMATAPDVFDQDEDGIALLLRAETGAGGEEELVREAQFLCPASAITTS